MKNKNLRLFPSTIAASFILLSPALHADAISWDAGGGDTNWSTLLNWSDDASPAGDDVTFNATGATASGTTNAVSANETINTLSYSFEDAANQHTTDIAAGQTLTVTGNFSVLTGTAPAASTNVSFTGTGTLNLTGNTVQLSNPTQASVASTTSVDMSALGTLTANLTGASSLFRVGGGGSGGNTTGNIVTLKLAANSTITAATVGVSDFSNSNTIQKMLLGSGTNTINSTALRVGNNSSGRSSGELSFNSGTGTLFLRGLDGSSAVTAMNMVNSTAGTTNNIKSVVNFAGHNVDAKITTLTMARRAGTSTGTTTGFLAQSTLTFDQGTFEVAGTTVMGANASTGALAGKIEAIINIGGGTASFGTINMADNTAGDTTKTITANLNLTGGTTTVNGDIARLGTTNSFANLTLNGASAILDMTAGNIGNLTNPVTLTLNSGTLKNVAEINGGGIITKTTAGTLTMAGTNTFTGNVTISAGQVIVTGSDSLGTSPKNVGIANLASVNLDGTAGDITLPSNITLSTAGLAIFNTAGNNTINGAISVVTGNGTTTATSDVGSLTLAGTIAPGATVSTARTLELSGTSTGANSVSGAITNGALTTINLRKSGAGTWAVTSASNTFTGSTTIFGGTLSLGATGTIATSASVSIKAGATLDTSGQASYTIPGAQPLTFELDPAASGSSGKIAATALNITSAVVTITPLATLDDPVYVLATYTAGNLTGTAFSSVTGVPLGYELDYDYQGNKIALVPTSTNNFASWAASQVPPVTGGENGDSDNDGVKNLVEYALVDGGERGVLGGNTITFTKRGAPYGGDVTYIIETSETLLSGSWADAVTQPAGDPATTISYTFTPSTPVKKFARLKVITTP